MLLDQFIEFIEQGVSPHLECVYAPLKVLFCVSSEDAKVLERVALAYENERWVKKERKSSERNGKSEQNAEEERREVGIPVVDEDLLLVVQGL